MTVRGQAATETFERAAKSVPAARRLVSAFVAAHAPGRFGFAPEQVVSELATNVVLHGGGSAFAVSLHLDADDDVLRVEVADASRRPPQRRHYSAGAATGRGLALVESFCRAWGSEPRDGGKVVWCEIGGAADSGVDGEVATAPAFDLAGIPPAAPRVPHASPSPA